MAASMCSGNSLDFSSPIYEELKACLAMARILDDAKKTALDAETKALNLLLGELCLNMHLLDEGSNDPLYRRSLVIINWVHEIPFAERAMIEIEDKLTLYEDGQLTRSAVVTIKGLAIKENSHCAVLPSEQDVNTKSAIKHFGFDTICENIIRFAKDSLSPISQMDECQRRITRASSLLSAMIEDISTSRSVGA